MISRVVRARTNDECRESLGSEPPDVLLGTDAEIIIAPEQ